MDSMRSPKVAAGDAPDERKVVLRTVLQTARSMTSLKRAMLLLIHLGLLFVSAYLLRPELAAIKNAVNSYFDSVLDYNLNEVAWNKPVSQIDATLYVTQFFLAAASDSETRYTDDKYLISFGEGVFLRWMIAIIDPSVFCDPSRTPQAPTLGFCVTNVTEMMNATSGYWQQYSDVPNLWIMKVMDGSTTREQFSTTLGNLVIDVNKLALTSPIITFHSVFNDGYSRDLVLSYETSVTTVMFKWANRNQPVLHRAFITHVSYPMYMEFSYSETSQIILLIAEALALCVACLRLIEEIHEMQLTVYTTESKTVWAYFRSGWNWVDLFSIVATFGTMIAAIIVHDLNYSTVQNNIINTSFSFTASTYFNNIQYITAATTAVFICILFVALVTCLSLFKLFHDIHPGLALFSMTMSLAARPLYDIILVVLYILTFVSLTVFLLFSWLGGNAQFTTLGDTFIQILNLCLGFYDYQQFTGGREYAWTVLVVFVSILFVLSVFGLVIISQNIILAIIAEAYAESKIVLIDEVADYPSLVSYIIQAIGFAIVQSIRLCTTCFFDSRKACEALLASRIESKWRFWRRGSSIQFPEMRTLMVSIEMIAGDAKVGGFTNDWGAEDLKDEDISEECRASRRILYDNFDKPLSRQQLQDLILKMVETHQLNQLKLAWVLPTPRFFWPKPEDMDAAMLRFTTMLVNAFGEPEKRMKLGLQHSLTSTYDLGGAKSHRAHPKWILGKGMVREDSMRRAGAQQPQQMLESPSQSPRQQQQQLEQQQQQRLLSKGSGLDDFMAELSGSPKSPSSSTIPAGARTEAQL